MCEIQRLTQFAFCFHSELRTVTSNVNIYTRTLNGADTLSRTSERFVLFSIRLLQKIYLAGVHLLRIH